jgi:hypothetical protein
MEKTALDDLPVRPQTSAKPWEGLFAAHLTLYISVILVAALASYAFWARTRSIFACPASGYSADRYIAYCSGANYGDYEHGAFLYGLEPWLDFASKADVLFLGNSRMQNAFSTTATSDWFSSAAAKYYLMGFSYGENMTFADVLLRKIRPRASVYVINVDDFFDRNETPPAKTVLYDGRAPSRYASKKYWQSIQEPVCRSFTALCGSKAVTFRSRETGAYDMRGELRDVVPVSFDDAIHQSEVDRAAAAGADFLKEFGRDKCVILTLAPYVETPAGDAKAIAASLGLKLVMPEVPGGLDTGDGSHLRAASAERWSQAFFQEAGPEIQSCLEKHRESAS